MWNTISSILNEHKMSVFELSKLTGYEKTGAIYRLKNGGIKRPSFEMMMRIADALNISLDDLRPDKGDVNA